MTAPPRSNSNATADRIIQLLLQFDAAHPTWTASDLSTTLSMPRSTVYRYLHSLLSAGLLEADDATGRYRLGPKILQLASVARRALRLPELALPDMKALSARSGETALLTKRTGPYVVCIERVESAQPIRLSYEIGQVLPVHAGASAKVLLAYAPPEEVDVLLERPLERFTERTQTDPDAIREELARIRDDGLSINFGEVDNGTRGISAPVLDADHEVVAGLGVAGPATRITDERVGEIAEQVRTAARAVSERLQEAMGRIA